MKNEYITIAGPTNSRIHLIRGVRERTGWTLLMARNAVDYAYHALYLAAVREAGHDYAGDAERSLGLDDAVGIVIAHDQHLRDHVAQIDTWNSRVPRLVEIMASGYSLDDIHKAAQALNPAVTWNEVNRLISKAQGTEI